MNLKITTTDKRDIEITPKELAQLFWEGDVEEQGQFFNELGKILEEEEAKNRWQQSLSRPTGGVAGFVAFKMQLQLVFENWRTTNFFTDAGKRVLEIIYEGLNEGEL